jgi:hypothetical protein
MRIYAHQHETGEYLTKTTQTYTVLKFIYYHLSTKI